MSDEKWLPVVGYEGLYEVSNIGRVANVRSKYVLRAWTNNGGYSQLGLSRAGRKLQHLVHRLVAEAFLPNPGDLPLVLHGRNGISDNCVQNLRWGNNSDNMRDRRVDGTDVNARKTHCANGHPYDEANTYRPAIGGGSHRQCRTCNSERREATRKRGLEPGDRRHGSMNGYTTYGCRCDKCVTENRAWRRNYMKGYRERS